MDITKFCAEEEPANSLYSISTPWVFDGWRYATDARIAVREPTDAPDDRPGNPELEDLFTEGADHAFAQLPEVPKHDGTGTEWGEPACVVADDPPIACKLYGKCQATEEGECTNKTYDYTPNPQRFAGKKWGGRYIVLINEELPGARYAIDKDGWMHFYSGDIEGVLAWMRNSNRGE